MYTVSQLARKHGITRSTMLYYEREGLLKPASRSDNGYRWYGEPENERLQAIVAYRSYGVPVAKITELLGHNQSVSQSKILRDHFNDLAAEIEVLRNQQKAIVALLQEPDLLTENTITKKQWIEVMMAAGFDQDEMALWHQTFEQMRPQEHQKFLESLGIDAKEIKKIRAIKAS
ncbi:MerR family transcriptional regulator [Microbulbifer sp. 2304DJ12-6]|uniref:MerR family transcriptional regulator n=1 Tax=Microbulbifer sp. 2304DJ12-6 TaxID=3233340 RepID=UPI0039AF4D0F